MCVFVKLVIVRSTPQFCFISYLLKIVYAAKSSFPSRNDA